MKIGSGALLILVSLAFLFVAMPVSVKAKPPNWWYEPEDGSIRWWADRTQWSFLVDLDGDNSTAARSDWGWWYHDYGTASNLGVVKIFYREDGTPYLYTYGWTPIRIGEWKISETKAAHIHETMFGDLTEWFYFTISKKMPPTNWMVILQGSDGTNPIPVTSTFWISLDSGATWTSYTP